MKLRVLCYRLGRGFGSRGGWGERGVLSISAMARVWLCKAERWCVQVRQNEMLAGDEDSEPSEIECVYIYCVGVLVWVCICLCGAARYIDKFSFHSVCCSVRFSNSPFSTVSSASPSTFSARNLRLLLVHSGALSRLNSILHIYMYLY